MKKILVVANDFPYPPNHGAAVDIWERILILNQMGYDLDLLATVREDPGVNNVAVVRQQVENLWTVPRRSGLKVALSPLPLQVRSRIDLQDIPLRGRYDAVILEAEHVAAFLKNPSARGSKLILRIHNDEARYFRELSKGNVSLRRKLFYYLESRKFQAFSPGVRKACDLLWFISEFERQEYVKRNPMDDGKSFFLPPGIQARSMHPYSAKGSGALFIGTLTIPHNADAVIWYINQIHPLLSDVNDYVFTVAGRTGGAPILSLKQIIAKHKNISLHEGPELLGELYESAAVFVNPVLRGAGLKLKTIQALQAGLPVVTTSVGMEGTGLLDKRHLLVANTPTDFAQCVRRILNDRTFAESLVSAAQAFLLEHYDMKVNLQKCLSAALSWDSHPDGGQLPAHTCNRHDC